MNSNEVGCRPITLSALSILKKWTKALEKSKSSDGAEVFVNHDCNRFTLNVILSVAFGIDKPWEDASGDQVSALRRDIELVVNHIGSRAIDRELASPCGFMLYIVLNV